MSSTQEEAQSADFMSSISSSSTAADRARRPKAQLSCMTCRIRKQKCDRNRPCQNCSKKNPTECVYVDALPSRAQPGAAVQKRNRGNSVNITDRLQMLESQIARLADKTSRLSGEDGDDISVDQATAGTELPQPAQDQYNDELTKSHSYIPAGRQGWHYISPSRWESILDDLEEIKQEASLCNSSVQAEFKQDASKPIDLAGPQLLFTKYDDTTKAELISSLPAKSVVYQLLDIFFKQDGIPPLVTVVLHAPTLLKECEQFWKAPQRASLVWLSMLFSILAISLQTVLRAERTIDGILLPEVSCNSFTTKSALCLKLSDYASPTKHTVEAMLLNLASEHFWIEREPFRASLVFSMIVRTAHRMGYHREPNNSPQKSAFEAEMQRRTWALIVQMDLFLAGKCALPRCIGHGQSNTATPANLLDEDLAEEMLELPASRPRTQRTVIGYLNYKTRLLTVHGRIIDQLNSSNRITFEETLRLDAELVAQVSARPIWLEPLPANEAQNFPIAHLGPLIDADMIVQRARMVLHYKFAIAARYDRTFWLSRKLASDAAETALVYQRILYDAAERSGGIKKNWRLLSLLSHDFLLAAMVLGLNINQDPSLNRPLNESDERLPETKVDEYLQHLQSSYEIWKACLDHSPSALEAHDIVKSILDKSVQARDQAPQYSNVLEMVDNVHLGNSANGESSNPQLGSNPITQPFPGFSSGPGGQDAYYGDMNTIPGCYGPNSAVPSQNAAGLERGMIAEQEMIDAFLGGGNFPIWNLNIHETPMGMF